MQQPTPNPAPAAPLVPNDPIQPASTFTGIDMNVDFPGDFGNGESDLLDNFDFDSFLNTTEDSAGGLGFGDNMQWADGGEVGAGDQ